MPFDDLTFRPATVADLPTVVALVNSAYRGEDSRAGWTTETDLVGGPRADEAMLRGDIDRPGSRIVLAERAGARQDTGPSAGQVPELVGCAHVTRTSGTAAYFGMFAVRPTAQGNGVGRALLTEAERVARDDWHLARLEMTVLDARAELLAYYGRRGYLPTGELEPFPPADADLIEVLREGLQLVVLSKDLV